MYSSVWRQGRAEAKRFHFPERNRVTMDRNIFVRNSLIFICTYTQSHYIEVPQGGVSSRAIHNWLWIFNLNIWAKKNKERKFIKKILCNFLVRKLQCFLKKSLSIKNTLSKVAHNQPNFFFSIANRPKTGPNHIFCSIKMSPCATSI